MGLISDAWWWFKWAALLIPYHFKNAFVAPSPREQVTSGVILFVLVSVVLFFDPIVSEILVGAILVIVVILAGMRWLVPGFDEIYPSR